MATIGIYDADFFRYENVIPNLECAKLCTYFHNHQQLAILTDKLEPERYTNFYIRKDYNDGVFPRQFFLPNCEYGGRAFNPTEYFPLETAIERTIPNMHLYDKFVNHFGSKPSHIALANKIIDCAHIRLSTDGRTPKTLNQLNRILNTSKYRGLIFHDYDLGSVENAYNIIYELTQTRHYVTRTGVHPYPIGNKFPIQIYSPEQLYKWLRIPTTPEIFFMQYNGIMPDETVAKLCEENVRMARQTWYNITHSFTTEHEFILYTMPKLFMQVLFLRRAGIKILLYYDEEKIITPELQKFIELLNCWLSFSFQENFLPYTQTLYDFVRKNSKLHYTSWAFLNVTVTTEEARDCFQFFRENYYDIFSMFYNLDAVILEGGSFINEWGRN